MSTVTDVPVGGGRHVRVRAWDGEGLPIVLLHGFCDSSEGWTGVARATPRPCFALDLPGFGGSDRVTRPDLGSYARTIIRACEELGISEATVVGHSFGGAVATAIAVRAPERVRCLALMAPAGFGRLRAAELAAFRPVRELACATMPLVMANPLACTMLYATTLSHRRLPSRELLARAIRHARGIRPGAADALAVLAAMNHRQSRFSRRLGYRGPVRAMWGERDLLVPPGHATGVTVALPQAQVDVWEGCGHHPQAECPQRLAEFIEGACACGEGRAGRGCADGARALSA